MRLQRCNQEHIMKAVTSDGLFQFFLGFGITVIDQFVELCQGFVEVVAGTDFINIYTDVFCDIPETFQRKAGQIGSSLDGGLTQFRTRFNE